MKHNPAWLDNAVSSAMANAEKLTYGGSATATVSSGSALFGLGINGTLTAIGTVVGIVVGLVGLYFQWIRHKALRAQEEREIKEHQVKMAALMAAYESADNEAARAISTISKLDNIDQPRKHK